MDMMAVVSLIFLVASIALGFWRKLNMGIIAIFFALILGRMFGVSDSNILGYFSTSLFLRLLGVMLLFSIAQGNGTIEKITKKVASLSGAAVTMIPVIIYLLVVAISLAGAGGPAGLALAAIITVPLAYQLKISPLKLAPAAIWGTCAGPSSLNVVGILASSLGAESGIDVNLMAMFITSFVGESIVFIVWYIASGWLRMESVEQLTHEQAKPFDRSNWLTLAAVLVLVFLTLVMQVDVGLAGFACSFILLIIPGVIDEKKAITGVPWGTLVMIGGMGILITMVETLGGIELISNGLASIMTVDTAPAVMSATGSVMSAVSSTTGVVMPTLIPTVPGIIESLGGGNGQELIFAITAGAGQTVISPLSTGGALVLAAYGNIYKPSEKERSKMFVELFLYAIAMMIVFAVFGLRGLYGWFI